MDFRGISVFWREVATKHTEQNSWAWAAEADSIEELIFHADGAAQLTEAWPRRVASAGWSAIVFGVPPDGTHRRLLRAACAPCMMDGQFSTSAPSAPAAELTAVGILLEEENSGARMRRVSWIDLALDVTTQRCRVNANAAMANHARGAWARVQRMTRAEACHACSHTGELGNECADVLAELGRRGLRWSPCLLDRLLRWVYRRLTTGLKCRRSACIRSSTGAAFWTERLGPSLCR